MKIKIVCILEHTIYIFLQSTVNFNDVIFAILMLDGGDKVILNILKLNFDVIVRIIQQQ